jgi:TonB-dependent SusC/RagA subfamily outer membrane receptor
MKKMICLFSALLLTITIARAQTRTITGTVSSEANGEPLAGASITIGGQTTGTTTGASGRFSITVASDENLTLVVSFQGYETQSIKPGSRNHIDIKLVATSRNLEEIVVVGYGTAKKRDLTGSVISVKNEEIKKVAAGNAMEALQGKMAGVDIVRTSGSAGATVNTTVRGNRSIIAGNGPLYIIDGIQYSNYQDINPDDIQSLEVLKDASSTAIYGSRGANGVIIITTRKGTAGKVKISANAYYGVSREAGYPKPMTGPVFSLLQNLRGSAVIHPPTGPVCY